MHAERIYGAMYRECSCLSKHNQLEREGERAHERERERRTGPFSSYSETTWFLLCKQKKKISKFDSVLEAVPSPSGRICVTVQGTALGWGAARGKNFSRSRYIHRLLAPLFHRNKHQLNSNCYHFYSVLGIRRLLQWRIFTTRLQDLIRLQRYC